MMTSLKPQDLFSEVEVRKKYIVTAGKNKYDRPLYVNSYNDCDTLDISAVPCIMSRTRASRVLKQIQKQFPEIITKYPRKYDKDTVFEMVEYVEKFGTYSGE